MLKMIDLLSLFISIFTVISFFITILDNNNIMKLKQKRKTNENIKNNICIVTNNHINIKIDKMKSNELEYLVLTHKIENIPEMEAIYLIMSYKKNNDIIKYIKMRNEKLEMNSNLIFNWGESYAYS